MTRRSLSRRWRKTWLGLIALAFVLSPAAAQAGHVYRIVVDGMISHASEGFIIRTIERAEQDGAAAVLIELDTPGGLVAATIPILKGILNAEVPVIVWVTPRGAWAASAGTFITVAGHVAAMSPGSSIGAAHPVTVGGENKKTPKQVDDQGNESGGDSTDVSMEKMKNILITTMEGVAKERKRNIEWVTKAIDESEAATADEALELGVIDFVVSSREELFEKAEGMELAVGDETVVISLKGAEVRTVEMSSQERFLAWISDPTILFILFLVGMGGIYIEANSPGLIIPGTLGVISLILFGYGVQIIPFSGLGLLLLVAGIGFFVAELFFASYGLLFGAGLVCMLIGGSMLFDMPEVNDVNVSFWQVVFPAVAGMGLFMALVVYFVGRSYALAQTAGVDEMIGLVGVASTALAPAGKIFIRGEYWNAIADTPVDAGQRVEVVAVDGLNLSVRASEHGQ